MRQSSGILYVVRVFLWTLLAMLVLPSAGCVEPEPIDRPIIRSDAQVSRGDSDNDGLCDDTEAFFGTNAALADSDRDGFPDWVEVRLTSDPTRSFSPDRTTLLMLNSEVGQELEVVVSASVRGTGDTVTGSLSAQTFSEVALASDYLVSASATSAMPPNNIANVRDMDFIGVRGLAELNTTLVFRSPAIRRDCVEVLPFAYVLRKENGETQRINRIMLRTAENTDLRTASWCGRGVGCW